MSNTKTAQQIVFTQFEFGMMAEAFDKLCSAKFKKDRLSALSSIRAFTQSMLSLKGSPAFTFFQAVSVTKVYSMEDDEVHYTVTYTGDIK